MSASINDWFQAVLQEERQELERLHVARRQEVERRHQALLADLSRLLEGESVKPRTEIISAKVPPVLLTEPPPTPGDTGPKGPSQRQIGQAPSQKTNAPTVRGNRSHERGRDRDESSRAPSYASLGDACVHATSSQVVIENGKVRRVEAATPRSRSTSTIQHLLKKIDLATCVNPSKWVTSPVFETVFCLLIMVNTLVMAFEAQYVGLGTGYELGIDKYVLESKESWPGAEEVFKVLEWIFGVLFTLELLAKFAGLHIRFFLDPWNWLDLAVVSAWIVDTVMVGMLPISPSLLRWLRLFRHLRLLRLVRKLQGFDALYILTTALKGSTNVLFWSFAMLFLIQLILALFVNHIILGVIEDPDVELALADRQTLFLYFGTCSRALLSMFEITLGNWPPVARLLQDSVNEFFVVFSLLHKASVGYALIAVINGVFMKETFTAADNDDKVMMRQVQRRKDMHIQKMKSFFEAADDSGDGLLSEEEFCLVIDDPEVRNWLAAMDLQVQDGHELFHLIDTGDDRISASELVQGVARLKGAAKSIDMVKVGAEIECLHASLESLQQLHGTAALGPLGSELPGMRVALEELVAGQKQLHDDVRSSQLQQRMISRDVDFAKLHDLLSSHGLAMDADKEPSGPRTEI